MNTICFGGQLASGKDTAADFLANANELPERIFRDAFAIEVKKIFCNAFGVDMDFIEKWKRNSEPPPGFLKNVRTCLIDIGDGFRTMKPNVWIRKKFDQAKAAKTKLLAISDGRYINELTAARDESVASGGRGYNCLLWRPGWENDVPSPSEQELVAITRTLIRGFNLSRQPFGGPVKHDLVDYLLINSGTDESLKEQVEGPLRKDIAMKLYGPECGCV